MKDRSIIDKYRSLPCSPVFFPDHARAFKKIGLLRRRGLLDPDKYPGVTPGETIGDILDIDQNAFVQLPTARAWHGVDLNRLQNEILSNPDALAAMYERFTEMAANPILSQTVEALTLTARSANCLDRANIMYIHDLVQLTEVDLLLMRNFGKKALNEIRQTLEVHGLGLGMRLENEQLAKLGTPDQTTVLPEIPYELSDLSLNYQFLSNRECKFFRKFDNKFAKNRLELISKMWWTVLDDFHGFGKVAKFSYFSLRNKILDELNALSKDHELLTRGENRLLKLSDYYDLNLGSIDQCLVDDIECYLFSLDDFDQNIALARWGCK